MVENFPDASFLTRRTFLLGTAQALCLGGLLFPLYRLQVRYKSRYETLAEKNRLATKFLTPGRGRLLDRHGTPLAHNTNSFRLVVIASTVQELKSSLEKLPSLIEVSPERLETLITTFRPTRNRLIPLVVREDLSWEEVTRLELHLADLPGVSVESDQSRSYPLGHMGVHAIGYVGMPSPQDSRQDVCAHLPGLRAGKTSLERAHEDVLRGVQGKITL